MRNLVRGIKREELEMLMQEQDIGIHGLTETWGRSDITVWTVNLSFLVSNYMGRTDQQ